MYVDVVPFVNNFVDLFSFTSLQSYLHILKKLIKKVDFLALYTISYDSRVSIVGESENTSFTKLHQDV